MGGLLEVNKGTNGLDIALIAVHHWRSEAARKLAKSRCGSRQDRSSRQKAVVAHCEQAADMIRTAVK